MTMLIRFLSAAQERLSPEEWEFFKGRYMSATAPVPVADGEPAADMRDQILRKLREGRSNVAGRA
ncbi:MULTISPECIES: hypothetical protein [unclassified Cupriavidus]|uniref:hypothetical protein n=1 Tax=unclassified Cupriavidus TaxID=2640874 RepID=UPI0010562E2A|nr:MULTISPECIES: hypothetical protein [unclassified Cupriavidus]TDF53915.1 hypothetical protein E1J61_36860 [Cupriavidus sp. L7L]